MYEVVRIVFATMDKGRRDALTFISVCPFRRCPFFYHTIATVNENDEKEKILLLHFKVTHGHDKKSWPFFAQKYHDEGVSNLKIFDL